jgi:outer membrane receptor protein involved in Fe transport
VVIPLLHRALLVGSVLPFAGLVQAQQPGSIRGVVTDRDFAVPIARASVQILETGQKTLTSDQGNFVFAEVPPGRYTLVFGKDGYVRQLKSEVVVGAGQLIDVDATLAGDFTDLEEFLVQDVLAVSATTELALLQLRLDSPAMVDSVGSELMSRAGAGDAAGALRLVAGATVANGKTAVIRGLPDRYVSSQLNGIRLPTANENKRAVELDQFPTEIVDSIQVSKTFTPDQQGDASGGAVDVRLRGIPEEDFFFRWRVQGRHNSQVTGRGDFLSYEGGGLSYWGQGTSQRSRQLERLGQNWDGAVGATPGQAPTDMKWSGAMGGRREIAEGVKIGGFFNFFHENESNQRDGVDESWWVESAGAGMSPRKIQNQGQGDFKTALYDIRRSSMEVKWGTLAIVGIESENHRLDLVHLFTRSAEDSVTFGEDTRGKSFFFPGYNPRDPNSPGFFEFTAAPWSRLETLQYTERTTETLQLQGRHRLASGTSRRSKVPELDWSLSMNTATADQPDKRLFGSIWNPGFFGIPSAYEPFRPAANINLGNLQRIWTEIEEENQQAAANLKLPFDWGRSGKGYVKMGIFLDRLKRRFNQDSFSNFNDPSTGFVAPWELPWSRVFPFENHPVTASEFDVDYRASQDIDASYAMVDLPLAEGLQFIGGLRYESVGLSIQNDPESLALWFPPSTNSPTRLNPGDADVNTTREDFLPSLGLVYSPAKAWTLRASYNQTVARQTFKELTPIQQQEYLGGPVFIGNPELDRARVRNYDLRVDYAPREGSLLSASWFYKDLDGPIEYVQRVSVIDYLTALNYPGGTLQGFEFEARESLGSWWEPLQGLSIGANATFIDSVVQLTPEEIRIFASPQLNVPQTTREMTNAPEHLYNLFLTHEFASTGTQLGLFYTVTGDTLIAGAGESAGSFVPSIYAVEFGRLNFSLTQPLGPYMRLMFTARNLTNPDRRDVYRSEYIDRDFTRIAFREGIDFTLSLGGELRF